MSIPRRTLLAVLGGGLAVSAVSGCGIVVGASRMMSDAVEGRLRRWAENQSSIASIDRLASGNHEGDVHASCSLTLISPIESSHVTDLVRTFFEDAGSDHWIVLASNDQGAVGLDSHHRDESDPGLLGSLWPRLQGEPHITNRRLSSGYEGEEFSVEVSDDPIAHGLQFVALDWVQELSSLSVSRTSGDSYRHLTYTPGKTVTATLAALKRVAGEYTGQASFSLKGTGDGTLTFYPTPAELQPLAALVQDLRLSSAFAVKIEQTSLSPSSSPT